MWQHIAHNNEIFIILTRDFSKEQYVLPEDDMRYAIETCRSVKECHPRCLGKLNRWEDSQKHNSYDM